MLRNLGIRWQILSALALPVLVLGLVSSQVTYQALLDMRDASQSRELAQAGSGFAVVIDGLATERALSEERLLGLPGAQAQLKAARLKVDRELAATRSQVYGSNSNNVPVQRVLGRLATVNALIPGLRADVDSGKAHPRAVAVRYSQIIAADVNVPFDLADTIADQGQAANFRDAGELGIAIEALAQEQLTGAEAITAGELDTTDQRDLGAAEATGAQALGDYLRTAPASQRTALTQALAARAARTAALTRARAALQTAGTTRAPRLTLTDWVAATNGQITALRAVFDRISAAGVAQATADYNSARKKLQLTLAGALAITLLTLALALALSRRVAAPLRRLTLAATQIRDELPRLVESLQSDEEFQLHLPVVSTIGRNEVSQLAAAFVDVNAVTVQIAREQARLRSAVGDMFVNVARRNQVLLARQLAFIDQLERNEVNPDSLEELFRLDHLATRMRRNAESLLVLAGIESGRRLREPMPLSDVVRTATSEIEHYSRVSLSLAVDPPLFAHLALPVAHLLAELLENATNFSDPGSTVVVMATATEHGVRMTVADDGLGMSAEELAEINTRIDELPTAEALSSQRLGFFVVGRLAQRLDAKVMLTSGRSRGTAVLIDLPAALFTPGALEAPGNGQSPGSGYGRPPAGIPAQPVPSPQPVPSVQPVQSGQLEPAGVPVAARPAEFAVPEPVGSSSPFIDVYSTESSTESLTGSSTGTALVAQDPVPAATTAIPMPSAPVIPAAVNVEALVADAETEPTWMPQPDALPYSAVPAAALEADVVAAPLARRGVAPAIPPLVQPAPVPPAPEPTALTSQWGSSEWAQPTAPAWAPSDWTEPEPTPSTISAEPEPPAGEPLAPAGPSLFSGFRSRREGQAVTAAPIPPVASSPAPVAVETSAPPANLEFAAPASFAEAEAQPDPASAAEPVHSADEWYEAPALSNPDSDRWQAWAEVSAANAAVTEPVSPDQAGDYAVGIYTPQAYVPASSTAEPPSAEPPSAEPPSAETPSAETHYSDAPVYEGSDETPYYPEILSPEIPAPVWDPAGDATPALAAPLQRAYEPAPLGYGTPPPYDDGPTELNAVGTEYEAAPGDYQPTDYRPADYQSTDYQPAGYESAVHQPEPAAYLTEPGAYPAEPGAYQPEPTGYQPESAGYQTETGEYEPGPYLPEAESASFGLAFGDYPPDAETTWGTGDPTADAANPASDTRIRTVTAAIDILPQRTSIRTALRRSRRKGDIPDAEPPFTGGFDPIVVARDFARREGFTEVGATRSPSRDPQPEIPQQAASAPEPAAPVERRQHQRRPPDDDGSGDRSALASEALTELSRLSSYSPTSMPASTAPSLQRRPPSEMPSEQAESAADPASQRTRTAASVRSMLAGFKAGVERGRTSPSANRPAGDRDAAALPQPRTSASGDE